MRVCLISAGSSMHVFFICSWGLGSCSHAPFPLPSSCGLFGRARAHNGECFGMPHLASIRLGAWLWGCLVGLRFVRDGLAPRRTDVAAPLLPAI